MPTLFSIPMLYNQHAIDLVLKLNQKLQEKTPSRRISSVYGALTQGATQAVGWENYRDRRHFMGEAVTVPQSIADMAPMIQQFRENDIVFQYCLNSTATLTAEMLYELRPKIFYLCDALLKYDIHHLKVSNLLLFDFIQSYYGDAFEYYLSTTREYSSILQYQTLFDQNPNIREICLPTDLNRDIRFIENFLRSFSTVRLEMMINEGCIYACPWRKDHTPHGSNTNQYALFDAIKKGTLDMPERMILYYTQECHKYRQKDPYVEYCLRRTVMPFDIPFLEALGVQQFKFAGRDVNTGYLLSVLESYLLGIDDFDFIRDLPWNYFNNYSCQVMNPEDSTVTIGEAFNYYPRYSIFKRIGHLCHSDCGLDCKYCYHKADAIRELVKSKLQVGE